MSFGADVAADVSVGERTTVCIRMASLSLLMLVQSYELERSV